MPGDSVRVDERGLVEHRRGPVQWLILNRPHRLNAFDWMLRDAILEAVESAAASACEALVLTGVGRGFCVGADVKDILEAEVGNDIEARRIELEKSHEIVLALDALDVPTLAAVDGVAAGGGWALALATDVVVATPRARFATAFAKLGLVPDLGAMHHLARRVGLTTALQILLARESVTVEEALAFGAVDHVVAPWSLVATVERLALGEQGPARPATIGPEGIVP